MTIKALSAHHNADDMYEIKSWLQKQAYISGIVDHFWNSEDNLPERCCKSRPSKVFQQMDDELIEETEFLFDHLYNTYKPYRTENYQTQRRGGLDVDAVQEDVKQFILQLMRS